ncbi:MAG: 50S ribosomal protein L13 [Candidatus Gracilibacteria bacterium]|nr:50S ribosomal protein L13 [Candidatus Gracilibacteria bacterium]
MKTINPKQLEQKEREWYVIDAKGLTLGRLASKIAVILRGKDKVNYASYVDNGDYVIVLNSDKFSVTGSKLSDKMYYTHSGYLGGVKESTLSELLVKKPTKALELAVSGMLPKNKLRKTMISRLKLVVGENHIYNAQQPKELKL